MGCLLMIGCSGLHSLVSSAIHQNLLNITSNAFSSIGWNPTIIQVMVFAVKLMFSYAHASMNLHLILVSIIAFTMNNFARLHFIPKIQTSYGKINVVR